MSGGEASWVQPSGRELFSPAPSYSWILLLGDACSSPYEVDQLRLPPTELHLYSIRNLSSIKAFRPTGMLLELLKLQFLPFMRTVYSLPFLGFLLEESHNITDF